MEIGALVKELQSGISARGHSGYWEMPRLQGRGPGGGGGAGGGMPRITWSFDSGLPDPATFPIDDLCRITEDVLRNDAENGLQYGGIAHGGIGYGWEGLRQLIVDRTREADGRDFDLRSVMLTSGGAHALTIACDAFLEEGDVFCVEAPTWGAVLGSGQRCGAEAISVPMDRDGLDVDELEAQLARLRSEGRRLKMLYTITTFNTPTGWSLSLPRRKRVLELADEYEFIVLEDNVYGELRYDGEHIPTLLSLDTEGYVVRVDSFSKTLAPALRMGSVTGAPEVVAAMSCVRGDLGVSQFLARVVAKYVAEGLYDKHVTMVNELYRRKRDLAAAALREHCGDLVSFDSPDGGFFHWLQISDAVEGSEVMMKAIENGVACRPGERFFGESEQDLHAQYLRMAFSMVPESELERGIAALAQALKDSVKS
jgi:2-aminoadipate transaminase